MVEEEWKQLWIVYLNHLWVMIGIYYFLFFDLSL